MHKIKGQLKSFGRRISLITACCLCITGCPLASEFRYAIAQDGPPDLAVDVSHVNNAVPKPEPLSRYGNLPTYHVNGKNYHVMMEPRGYEKVGIASWYGKKFDKHRTSSGETYNMLAMTAAHRSLPIPCYVRVTNLRNHREVIVRVNDRGPFHDERLIDLSYAAAKKLGIVAKGTGLVKIQWIDPYTFAHKRTPKSHSFSETEPKPLRSPARQLFVQVGAFSHEQHANNLASELGKLVNYPVLTTPSTNDQKTIYRVKIGPLRDGIVTDHVQQLVETAGFGHPFAIMQ